MKSLCPWSKGYGHRVQTPNIIALYSFLKTIKKEFKIFTDKDKLEGQEIAALRKEISNMQQQLMNGECPSYLIQVERENTQRLY